MKKKSQQLPQIYRIIPAWGVKTVVLGAVAAFLALNLFTRLPAEFTGIRQAKSAVMLSPNDISSHLLLVQEYLAQGNMDSVERELTLAQDLTTSSLARIATQSVAGGSSVLGLTLSPLKILEEIKAEPQKIQKEIAFWEKIVTGKPNYRDAYLQLAILHYQIYETQKTKAYLGKAMALDPNFEVTKKLEELLKN